MLKQRDSEWMRLELAVGSVRFPSTPLSRYETRQPLMRLISKLWSCERLFSRVSKQFASMKTSRNAVFGNASVAVLRLCERKMLVMEEKKGRSSVWTGH